MKKIYKFGLLMTIVCMLVLCFASCTSNVISAYDIAVKNGFNGTEAEWLNSLKGADGNNAESITVNDIYDAAVQEGFDGTLMQFLQQYLDVTYLDEDISTASNKAMLSVVSIVSKFSRTVSTFPFGTSTNSSYSAAGSGVIYKLDKAAGNAYIITNYHVVFDIYSNSQNHISNDISVYLYGQQYADYAIAAQYVGGSMTYDIAVLKIENSPLLTASQAIAVQTENSENVVVGQTIFVVGNPESEGLSVTKGIVSVNSEYITMTASDNVTQVEFRVIRIDAGVNGGNSGGGLFDKNGKLIGIINAKVVADGVEAMGFAIPINVASAIADKIILNNGDATKCMLGITVKATNSRAIYDTTTQAVYIEEDVQIDSVESTGLANQKLMAGDVLVSFTKDNQTTPLTRTYMLAELLIACNEGEQITINILRNNQPQSVTITLTSASLTPIK